MSRQPHLRPAAPPPPPSPPGALFTPAACPQPLPGHPLPHTSAPRTHTHELYRGAGSAPASRSAEDARSGWVYRDHSVLQRRRSRSPSARAAAQSAAAGGQKTAQRALPPSEPERTAAPVAHRKSSHPRRPEMTSPAHVPSAPPSQFRPTGQDPSCS